MRSLILILIIKRLWIAPFILLIGGCVTGRYVPVDNVAKLDVAFTDSRWTGGSVPKVGVCARNDGEGMSPPLVVRRIPSGTTDIIVEFNDLSYDPLSSGGGHGSIRVPVDGKTEVLIPSVPGETFKLPSGVFMESAHQAQQRPGAYLGPCSRRGGNFYEADVLAVSKSTTPSEPSRLLGKTSIMLGTH